MGDADAAGRGTHCFALALHAPSESELCLSWTFCFFVQCFVNGFVYTLPKDSKVLTRSAPFDLDLFCLALVSLCTDVACES